MRTFQILLAEDNPGDVFLVRQALKEHLQQFELHVVKDGGQALDSFKHIGEPGGMPCPDLMLLDLNLPKVEGSEVLTEFRKHPACSHTPVVVISSSDTGGDREQLAALHVSGYFRKPSDYDDFMKLGEVVRQLLPPQEIL